MKSLHETILEKLKLSNVINEVEILYTPKTKDELIYFIDKVISDEGESANLNCIDTSNITDMHALFSKHKKFNGLVDNWNVSKVRDFSEMFKNCKSLKKLNLTSWDVSKARDLSEMFSGCTALESIGNVEHWDVSKIKFMQRTFENCQYLKLDISKWNFNEKCNKPNFTYNAPNIIL